MKDGMEIMFNIFMLVMMVSAIAGVTVFIFKRYHLPTGYKNCEAVYINE